MNLVISFRPKLFEALKRYSAAQFRRDFGAGVNVMIMAFPLSIAFAIASGAKPEQGLFTAIIAGGLVAALGGSNVQISGPTGAFVSQITAMDETNDTEGSQHSLVGREIPPGVLVFRVFGAFFFGVVDKLDDELKRAKQDPNILILRVRKVLAMDATGLQALEDLHAKLRAKGKYLLLSAAHTQPLLVMEKAGFLDRLGRENVCPDIAAALARARYLLTIGEPGSRAA